LAVHGDARMMAKMQNAGGGQTLFTREILKTERNFAPLEDGHHLGNAQEAYAA